MTDYNFGQIVLVPFPFSDQSASKKRPAAVISSQPYHQDRPDLLLLAVTSQVRPTLNVGDRSIENWQEAGLLKPSVLKPVVTTIERRLVLKTLGILSAEDQSRLRSSLDEILGRPA